MEITILFYHKVFVLQGALIITMEIQFLIYVLLYVQQDTMEVL
jgi:hypothetical protein